jgi:2-methylcitrate dehydratase PrpD
VTGLTEYIARFIQQESLADCPQSAPERAKKVIADTFAAMLAGANAEVTAPLLRYLDESGEQGASAVLGTSRRATPELAALINGTFGHALDFDDVLSMMPAHPSAVILAALCAEAESRPFTGRALIEAHIMGIEVGGKLGLGVTMGHYHRGFHATGTLGIFSAVAALAKRDGLDPATTRTAFGIASSMASGLQRNFGTMTKPLHTGWAARSALVAVRLAACGYSAAPDALEANAGFFAAYGVPESNARVTARELGNPWVIVDPGVALKKFACCYACHRGMDGVLALRAKHAFTAADVVRLECRMPPGGMRVLTYATPNNGLQGKFSLEYCLAAGVLDGQYTLWSFTDEAVQRPAIRETLARIAASEDARCRGDDPLFETRSSGSRGFVEVEVTLANGVTDRVRVERAPGHPSRELTWSDIEAKFHDCATQAALPRAKAQAAFALLRELERCADVRELTRLMHRAP